MKKHLLDLKVLGNTKLNHNHNLIGLGCELPLPPMVPGQFAEVRVDHSPATFLRRPFSIHRVDKGANTMHLLVKSVGEGTRHISGLTKGSTLNVMFPLGNGFTITQNKEVLLVGGGCGVAPLYFLADQLFRKGNKVSMLIGGRSAADILLADEYRSFGNVYIATEDGTLGEKGMVTAHSVLHPKELPYSMIYCCGPDGMMKTVAHIAESKSIACEVSLENTMACGIGACLCCVVETRQGNQCVCTEGPVFNTTKLKGWTAETEIGCSLDN
jgi:dihydroorotate dehydrogenase electron transfer subunit